MKSIKSSESYWGNQGQYQDLYNKYHSEIPDEGSVNDSLLEQLRIVSNVYYEVGNNGGGNMISGMGSAGEHIKINASIPETIRLVNRIDQAEDSGGLEYDEEQRLIQASLNELDGVINNLLQQIKNDRADKDEQSNYWGESKASETFYDQALWLAKAKLEQNGLDIVDALPDIIRNTRTSTGRDFDEAELNRAIEDAIVIYKDMLVTGMSMWGGRNTKASELAPTIEDMKYDTEPMRFGDGHGVSADPLYPESTKKEEPKLDTEEEIDNYIKEGTDPAPYEEEDMPESIKSELKDEAEEIIGALAVNDELEGIKDTYGSSPNADPTTTPLEDHSGTDDSSDAQYSNESEDDDLNKFEKEQMDKDWDNYVERDVGGEDPDEDTVEESFGDCGCKDTKKAKMTWESAKEGDKQYWLRDMGEDEGYSYYHFEHLPKRVGESLVDKFKVEESEDRGWSKIPALERANLLRKLGFPPRDAELVANLEYPQLSESLKKDVNDAVIVKKRAEESKREKPDEQLAFENDLYSNMYDGYLKRRGERVDSKKNDKF